MFKKIKNFFIFLFFGLAFFLGCWVYVDNTDLVKISLFGFSFDELSLGLILVVTLSLGILVGLCGNALITLWMALQIRRLKKQTSQSAVEKKSA